MTYESPLWMDGVGSYSGSDDRRHAGFSLRPGVGGTADLAVTQRAAGVNMSVDVAAGMVCIPQGQGTETIRRNYVASSTSVQNVAISTAPGTAGQSRNDLIVAQLRDAAVDAGSNNDWLLTVVQGTAAATGSQVDPATPNQAVVLARVTVANGNTTIVNAQITDLRNLLTLRALDNQGVATSGTTDGIRWVQANKRFELVNESVQDSAFAGLGTSGTIINTLAYDDPNNRPGLVASTDGGNLLKAGTDGNLYAGTSFPASITIANFNQPTSSSRWYRAQGLAPSIGSPAFDTMTFAAGYASFVAFAVGKSCTLGEIDIFAGGASGVGGGNQTFYAALYTASATGAPSTKVADLGNVVVGTTSAIYAISVGSPPTLSPNTLYYLAVWAPAASSSSNYRLLGGFPVSGMSQLLTTSPATLSANVNITIGADNFAATGWTSTTGPSTVTGLTTGGQGFGTFGTPAYPVWPFFKLNS